MPELLFQFQNGNNTSDGPDIDSLEHLLKQNDINFDGIKAECEDAVSVNFSSPEEAKNAYKNLDGMELMGSVLIIKPTHTDSTEYFKEGRNHRRYQNKQTVRDEYSRFDYDQDKDYYRRNNHEYQRYTSTQYPCRILIPSDMVKVVLGKAGVTITAIQNKTNTKIDVHRDKSPLRGGSSEDTMVTIKGESEPFSEAIREILTVINLEYEKREYEEQRPLQLKLLAHDLLCGRIIGKAGNNLKQTKQESNVSKLIISNSVYEEGSHMLPNSFVCTGERVIVMEGSVDGLCIAEGILSKKLREYMDKDQRNTSRGNSSNDMKIYCGGYGYTNSMYSPQMMYPRVYGGYAMGCVGYGGFPGYMNSYPGILGHGYMGHGGNLYPQPFYGGEESETTCVLIPTKEVGAVIGRNGGYISRIKQYSGAQLRVIKPENEGEDSKVEVVGPPECQWKAALCIFSKIKETMKVTYSEAHLKTEYYVPGVCVGRIIGKKGQVVQDIQEKAQADIEVPKEKQGLEDVPVFITGTFSGTQIALNRIRDIVFRARQKKASPPPS